MRITRLSRLIAACSVMAIPYLGGCDSGGEDNRGAAGAGADGTDVTTGGKGGASSTPTGGEAGQTTTAAGAGGLAAGKGGQAAGQGGAAGVNTQVVEKSLSALVAVDNCDKVLAQLKERTIKETEQILDNNLKQALQIATQGGSCPVFDAATTGTGNSGTPKTTESGGATQYSTTNTQVVGVDEADFVKNDAKYIYVVADGKFQIIDAWPAAQAHTVASVTVTGTPKKLYVNGNIAVIYTSLGLIEQSSEPIYFDRYWGMTASPEYNKECTYGYSCDFTGDGYKLAILTYDISDKTSPKLLRQTELSGAYLNSRRIDNIVHTVVTFPEIALPGLDYWPTELEKYRSNCGPIDNFPYTESEIRALFDKLKAKNKTVIQATTVTDYLPGVKDTRYVNGKTYSEEGLLNSCNNFYLSQTGDGRGFLALVSFDMSVLEALGTTTIVGKPGAVYASTKALYVAVRHYSTTTTNWFYPDTTATPEATTIHKFAVTPGSITTAYAGSGVTKGRVLNQFSMDEYEDNLRIATTTGHLPNSGVHSTLSVLAESEAGLVVIGTVDNIAPTEDIRSVRFDGDTGYIVTFKKTDPLFVFDLADARKPAIKGELKIPGYSTYIHLMDDTHLLTMGYDAADQGNFAWFQGIQLQVMDVAALNEPKLLYKEVIGTRGSTSEAATNHLAFNYFPQRELLAIPMTICAGGTSGTSNYGDMMTFGGLLVYRVSVSGGFTALGGVPHETPETTNNNWGACSSWWTDSNSKVKRSIFMSSDTEDFVYSIALDLIKIANLKDLAHPIKSIIITTVQPL